jgi:hypothetical protein
VPRNVPGGIMSDWRKAVRYRIGTWLIDLGQQLIREAERLELVNRIAIRLRREPKGPGYDRRAKDIAADEATKFYVEKQDFKVN